jgi:7,8-dihydro-6-hydroxymethylpterin dimethyltransferase
MKLPSTIEISSPTAFLEETLSICPVCRQVVKAHLQERAGQVIMSKDCPQHGSFEALVYGDAELYSRIKSYTKPGQAPLQYSTEIQKGCPFDCGLCTDHHQHLCLGIIEVNSICNLECPLCVADSGPTKANGFSLTFEQVNSILDRFIVTEGQPEVVQFSGGEPSLHPRILDFIALARQKGISYVMLNTNGIRIARDDRFLEGLAKLNVHIYLQFDGFDPHTLLTLRGRADLLEIKLKALERLGEAGLRVILVPAIERGVNEHEIGRIVDFGLSHPAVFGISFQSVFHAQRHPSFDPLERVTAPDILKALENQLNGVFRLTDFIPIPCCAPTCAMTTYALLMDGRVLPVPRMLPVESSLDYVKNRTMPALDAALLRLLESLWSAGAKVGSDSLAHSLFQSLAQDCATLEGNVESQRCISCRLGLPISQHKPLDLARHVFMISVRDFMDPWTFDVRDIHRCCIGVLLPDGRTVPFCAYNSLGYREQFMEEMNATVFDESHRNGSIIQVERML